MSGAYNLIKQVIGLARLQQWIAEAPDAVTRKWIIMFWWERGIITAAEAEMLIEHNQLEAA